MPETTHIGHYGEYPVIRCPTCEQEFVLVNYWPATDDDGISYDRHIPQVACSFCPYCGKNIPNPPVE